MGNNLRYDVADQRLKYTGPMTEFGFEEDRVIEFNHRHRAVLANYELGTGILCDSQSVQSGQSQIELRSAAKPASSSVRDRIGGLVGDFGRSSWQRQPEFRTQASRNE